MLLCNIYFIFWCHGISWLLCGVEANGVLWMLCVIFHFVYSDFNRLLFATLFPSPIQFIILWWFLSDFLRKRCQYMWTRVKTNGTFLKGIWLLWCEMWKVFLVEVGKKSPHTTTWMPVKEERERGRAKETPTSCKNSICVSILRLFMSF